MGKVTIIGQGPAGISASLYIARSGNEATVISMGTGALGKAHLIENYYGFAEPVSGMELELRGIEQAKRLGVKFIKGQVTSLGYDGSFIAKVKDKEIKSDALILATGSPRTEPKIKGLKDFDGTGVSYCAVCDGFFHRGNAVAVLGNGDYAIHEAEELLPIAGSVTLLTNGENLNIESPLPENIKVDTRKITEIVGHNHLEAVNFQDGAPLEISGFFVAIGSAGSGALAKKIGAVTTGNKIVVNGDMSTNIPGLYAAGDAIGGILQVSTAVAEGTMAAMSAIKFLKSKK